MEVYLQSKSQKDENMIELGKRGLVCKSQECKKMTAKKSHNPFLRFQARVVQRDVNAALNIRHCAMEVIRNGKRPTYLDHTFEE